MTNDISFSLMHRRFRENMRDAQLRANLASDQHGKHAPCEIVRWRVSIFARNAP